MVQGKSIPVGTGSSAVGAIDTGTTLIGGPTAAVQAIYDAIPNSQAVPNSGGLFAFRKYRSRISFILLTSCIQLALPM
jgi:cathepsin D